MKKLSKHIPLATEKIETKLPKLILTQVKFTKRIMNRSKNGRLKERGWKYGSVS